MFYGLGDIKAHRAKQAKAGRYMNDFQRLLQESRELYESALDQLKSTVGESHDRTGDVYYKLATLHSDTDKDGIWLYLG